MQHHFLRGGGTILAVFLALFSASSVFGEVDDCPECASLCTTASVEKERSSLVEGGWTGPEHHYVFALHDRHDSLTRLLIITGSENFEVGIGFQSSKDGKFGPYSSMSEAEGKVMELCPGGAQQVPPPEPVPDPPPTEEKPNLEVTIQLQDGDEQLTPADEAELQLSIKNASRDHDLSGLWVEVGFPSESEIREKGAIRFIRQDGPYESHTGSLSQGPRARHGMEPLAAELDDPSGYAYLRIQAQQLRRSEKMHPATRLMTMRISQALWSRTEERDPLADHFSVLLLFGALADRAREEAAGGADASDREGRAGPGRGAGRHGDRP
jgi:hypothetical protein